MGSPARSALTNIVTIARRELMTRATTRTFLVSTIILIAASAAVALTPVAIGFFGRGQSHVAVYVGATDLQADPVAIVDGLLNPPDSGASASSFSVSRSSDREASRAEVSSGTLTALLDVERNARGETTFTLFTMDPNDGATAVVARQAATAIAVADRVGRLGLPPSDQARLFAPPEVDVRSPDLSRPAASTQAAEQQIADTAVVVALEMFLLLALMFYGTWIAQSVVEEKSSRMMEIILATASPFQLLAGKVLGVSTAAFLQLGAALATAVVVVVAQGQVAQLVLGAAAGVSLPSGLTPTILVAFSVLFVLGFVLYAVLFATAGSMVSRQEDVSQLVTPMTLLVCGAYLVALYAYLGSIDIGSPWVVALSWVPLLSPYLMLSRLSSGTAGPLDVALAAALLAVTIVVLTWAAARIYAAGVLLYGQRPSARRMWRALREAR